MKELQIEDNEITIDKIKKILEFYGFTYQSSYDDELRMEVVLDFTRGAYKFGLSLPFELFQNGIDNEGITLIRRYVVDLIYTHGC